MSLSPFCTTLFRSLFLEVVTFWKAIYTSMLYSYSYPPWWGYVVVSTLRIRTAFWKWSVCLFSLLCVLHVIRVDDDLRKHSLFVLASSDLGTSNSPRPDLSRGRTGIKKRSGLVSMPGFPGTAWIWNQIVHCPYIQSYMDWNGKEVWDA